MTTRCSIRVLGVLVATAALGAGCSDDDTNAQAEITATASTDVDTSTTTRATTSVPETTSTAEPAEPTVSDVDISGLSLEPLGNAGAGVSNVSDAVLDAAYSETEYLVAGTASTYAGPAIGPAEVATEGNPYVTRIVVRMPTDPAAFSGRVVVEPFNTSAGTDADVVWGFLATMMVEQGDVWVGVSERFTSMESMKAFDSVRYAEISIPSNGLAWDMLSQIGGLLDEGGGASPLGDLDVEHVYMAGYSQNGIDTATYASTFGELALMSDGSNIYDGFLPLAHSGSMTPLDSGAVGLPPFEFVPVGTSDVPVIDLESESDVIGFFHPAYSNPGHASARREDSDEPGDLYRLYEIPGGSHVKASSGCDHDGTTFPLEYFVRAVYRLLIEWVEEGTPPPSAERIAMESIDIVSVPERDEHGNALGGVRSPFLDVPIATYQGGDTGPVICALAGVETPLDAATLDGLYDGVEDFLTQFEASLAETIDAGFLLADDADEILDYAEERAQIAFA